MKKKTASKRKCSAALVAGAAGAAVCLSGGNVGHAAFTSGTIFVSNGNNSTFGIGSILLAGNGSIAWFITSSIGHAAFSALGVASGFFNYAGPYLQMHPAGVTVSAGLPPGFNNMCWMPPNVVDGYMALVFQAPGPRYGWLHVVASDPTGTIMQIDTWGYENAGLPCKTLADSVTTRRLDLADGRVKLHWTNDNEDGVARYEVQTKDGSGAWQAVDSDTPGACRYTATISGDADCRLVVEKVDGETEEIAF